MSAGRYAPSPTGTLHVGNLRTALLAWLAARASNRPFLVRVEDLDRVRSGAESQQLADLAAVGVNWDAEPVRQSERTQLYTAAVQALRAAHGEDAVYECYCSRKDIAEAGSAPHPATHPDAAAHHDNGARHLAPEPPAPEPPAPSAQPTPLRPPGFYPGTCRTLTPAQRAERRAQRPAALRLNAALIAGLQPGHHPEATAQDRLHGTVTGLVDDLVVRRNDGAYAYNLAVVVDDLHQGINQVVRADDLLDSTPRQRWLTETIARAQSVPAPDTEYLHVPLVVNAAGQRLAKRDGSVTLEDLTAAIPGLTPAHVRDRLLESVGLPPGPLPDVVAHFDPDALPRDPWVFDEADFTEGL
ncbi:MAG: tRNA glutamyl-Q(34) synthetase GluQRS [Micrococcus sp.]|nr:tRNA glutamyl-Q(34) synthetase GluQRS [Micrococcus sp.]